MEIETMMAFFPDAATHAKAIAAAKLKKVRITLFGEAAQIDESGATQASRPFIMFRGKMSDGSIFIENGAVSCSQA